MVVDRSFQSLWTVGSWADPIGGSCIGSSHRSTGKPNQDSYLLEQWDERGATFAAISDGHGDEKYWRSDAGSKLAVQGFKELLQEQFLPLIRDPDQDPQKLRGGWETIGKALRTRWLQLCAEHLQSTPFSAEENARIIKDHRQLIRRPIIAYGATLSGALLFQDYGFFLHLGDGDLLGMDSNAKIETLFEEPEVKANDTASLCQQNGHRGIRTRIVTGEEWRNSQMIVLATDGVGDAFGGDEDAFHAHMSKYQNRWREKGRDALATGVIQNELSRFSDLQASGDDSTILILKRIEKEDHLTRSEFEKAWCDFEDKSRTSEAESLRKIQQTGSEIDSRVLTEAQQTIAALQQEKQWAQRKLEELGKSAHNLLKMDSRIQQLEQSTKQRKQWESKLKTILKKTAFVLLAFLVVWALVSIISDVLFSPSSNEPNAPASSEQGNSGVQVEEGKLANSGPDISQDDSTASQSSTILSPEKKPEPAEQKHKDEVRTVAFDPEGNRYASGSFDHTIIIWDAQTHKLLQILEDHGSLVNSVSWSPDGKRLASGSVDGQVLIWTLENGENRNLSMADSDSVTSLSWSPNNRDLAIGLAAGKVQIWNVQNTSQRTQPKHQHKEDVWSVSWNPSAEHGDLLASVGQDEKVIVTSVTSETSWTVVNLPQPQTPGKGLSAVAWSPDGTRLATGSKTGHIVIFKIEPEKSELVFEHKIGGHKEVVYCVSWSHDGLYLASGSADKTLRIWHAATGEPSSSPIDAKGAIHSISWSPVGQTLIYSLMNEVKEYRLGTPDSSNSTAGEGDQTSKGANKSSNTGADESDESDEPDEPDDGEAGSHETPEPTTGQTVKTLDGETGADETPLAEPKPVDTGTAEPKPVVTGADESDEPDDGGAQWRTNQPAKRVRVVSLTP